MLAFASFSFADCMISIINCTILNSMPERAKAGDSENIVKTKLDHADKDLHAQNVRQVFQRKKEGRLKTAPPAQDLSFISDTRHEMALHDWKGCKAPELIHAP